MLGEAAIIKRIKDFARRAFSKTNSGAGKVTKTLTKPIVLTRDQHSISRKQIDENALKVLYRLHNAGFEAYLVGGCVRDLLLGIQPKDFDVTTNAKPEQVKNLFRNCRLVGRRFRLAHIVFGREVIEVATFRGHHDSSEEEPAANSGKTQHSRQNDAGMLVRDNVYGSIEEDAARRDFTVNALYYNIADFAIYDYANGVRDLNDGLIRMIGDPVTRYREDPVRMLRAVRFATKLNMRLDASVSGPLLEFSTLLQSIPAARMFEESLKLLAAGKAVANFDMLSEYNLFQQLFPQLKSYLKAKSEPPYQMIRQTLADTDARIQNGQRITPAYLFAALLWWPLQARQESLLSEGGLAPMDALNLAASDVFGRQVQTISVPKRFSIPAREIWQLQSRLARSKGKRAETLLTHPRFRAAYDFLLLRAKTAGADKEQLTKLAEFWTRLQKEVGPVEVKRPDRVSDEAGPSKRRRGGRGGRNRRRKPPVNKGE